MYRIPSPTELYVSPLTPLISFQEEVQEIITPTQQSQWCHFDHRCADMSSTRPVMLDQQFLNPMYLQISSNNLMITQPYNLPSQSQLPPVQPPLMPVSEYSFLNQLGLDLGYHPNAPRIDSSWGVTRICTSRIRGYRGFGRRTPPSCQVDGCKMDLTRAKRYHKRHKVCEFHSKAPVVYTHEGMQQRFCQQCSRFHSLDEFDNMKKSCRRRLADHNKRRRKQKLNTLKQIGNIAIGSSERDADA